MKYEELQVKTNYLIKLINELKMMYINIHKELLLKFVHTLLTIFTCSLIKNKSPTVLVYFMKLKDNY